MRITREANESGVLLYPSCVRVTSRMLSDSLDLSVNVKVKAPGTRARESEKGDHRWVAIFPDYTPLTHLVFFGKPSCIYLMISVSLTYRDYESGR